MRRALVVAEAEFRAFIRSRSFLIGLLLPPLLGGIAGVASWAMRSAPPPAARAPSRIAILDHTGSLFGTLEIEAAQRNGGPAFERVEPSASPDGLQLAALEGRVRSGELRALIEIPAEAAAVSVEPVRLRVVARDTADELAGWLEDVVREELRMRALRSAGVSAALRARLERAVVADVLPPAPAPGEASGLAPDPHSAPPTLRVRLRELGSNQKLVVSLPLAFILFFAVTVTTAPLFQAVLEEKTSRVSEILISSVSPFELTLGKLLGSLGACGITAFVYGGLLLTVLIVGFGAALPIGLLGLFTLYLVLSLLLWGSIFLAVGAACVDLKDAQNLTFPVLFLQVLPLMFLHNLFLAPTGGIARFLSLFPPTSPIAMIIRLGFEPTPSILEIVLSVVLLASAAFACLWAASRVLRVGLLVQGRSASLRDILRWVWTG